jgi:hypothetical protein
MPAEKACRQDSFQVAKIPASSADLWVTLGDGQAWAFPPIDAHIRMTPGQPALIWIVGGKRADEFGFVAERIALAGDSATDEDKLQLYALALLQNYMMPYPTAAALVATAAAELQSLLIDAPTVGIAQKFFYPQSV